MKDKLFVLGKFIGVLIFILAFSMMGLASGKPIMVLAYAGFFIAVMLVIFQFVKKHQRHFEITSERSRIIPKIVGIVMLLSAIALPVLSVGNLQLFDMGAKGIGLVTLAVVLVITVALIAGGVLGVSLINRSGSSKLHRILGYLIIILASAVPALLIIPYDKTTTGIGSVYYIAILVAVLSWWGINLYLNKE
jgi:hypothetical protein